MKKIDIKKIIKGIVFLCIGLAIGYGLKGGMADMSKLNPKRPVVVELYTSLGCPQCPTAEEFLIELGDNYSPDVLPLSFHVVGMNTPNWKDNFSQPEFSERHRRYIDLAERNYTPQMIIDGRRSIHGADTVGVERLILQTAQDQAVVDVDISATDLPPEEVAIEVGGFPNVTGKADIYLIGFDAARVGVTRTGKEQTLRNVVREIRTIGTWTGDPLSIKTGKAVGERQAVILQGESGRILGAAQLR